MSATYLVDDQPVDLDAAREAFETRQLDELAAACALIELRARTETAAGARRAASPARTGNARP